MNYTEDLDDLLRQVKASLDEIQVRTAGIDDDGETEEIFYILNADYDDIKCQLTLLQDNEGIDPEQEREYEAQLQDLLEQTQSFLDDL